MGDQVYRNYLDGREIGFEEFYARIRSGKLATTSAVSVGDFSIEFCGGTHVDNTAKLGLFKIISESSVASGVRRIEATVGKLSLEVMNKNQELMFHVAQILKTNPGELAAKAEQQVSSRVCAMIWRSSAPRLLWARPGSSSRLPRRWAA